MGRPLYAKEPCSRCPWRVDVSPGEFPASRYEALEDTVSSDYGFGQPMFACHKSAEGKEITCAGFLAVAGNLNITVRLNVLGGHIPASALRPQPGWPELWPDYETMAARQAGE